MSTFHLAWASSAHSDQIDAIELVARLHLVKVPTTDIEPANPRLPRRDSAESVTRRGEIKASRWDLWASFIAAGSLILVVSGGLLVLTLELRSGWVSDHEVLMDKAPAIHKLLFRQ